MTVELNPQAKKRLAELNAQLEAYASARDNLQQVVSTLQQKLHYPHPDKFITNTIEEFSMKMAGIRTLITRIETVGR